MSLGLGLSPKTVKAEEERKLSEVTLKSLEKIKNGEANRSEILKTAEQLLSEGFPESAKKLYEEHIKSDDSIEAESNYATSLVKSKQLNEGIKIYKSLLSRSGLSEDQVMAIRKNLLAAIQSKKSEDKQKGEEKNSDQNSTSEGENQKSKDQGNSNQNGKESNNSDQKNENDKNKSNKNNKNQKGNQKDSGEERDLRDLMNKEKKEKDQDKGKEKDGPKKQDDENKKEEKEKNKNGKNENKDEKNKGKEDSPESFEEREERMRRQRKMKKTPAILKQTLDLDRELQKKFLDASKEKVDSENVESRPSKDW